MGTRRPDQARTKAIRQLKERIDEKEDQDEQLPEKLEDLIDKWREKGPLSFTEDAYYIRRKGKLIDVEPWTWQEELLEQVNVDGQGRITNPLIFLSTPSRQGKSLLARFLFAYELICADDFKGYFISESRETLQNAVWSELKEELLASPILSQIISEKDIQRREINNKFNNSTAKILPQKTPIGIRADMMGITELWKLESADILTGSYLRISESNGTLLVDSLLPDQDSDFRQVMDLSDDEDALVELHQGEDAFFLNPNMDQSQLKRLKTMSLKKDFETQVLNAGKSSGIDRAFEDRTIQNSLRDYYIPVGPEVLEDIDDKKAKSFEVCLGLDRSQGKQSSDNTVLISLVKIKTKDDKTRYVLAQERSFPESSGEKIRNAIEGEYKRLGAKLNVALESYQNLDLHQSLEKADYVKEAVLVSPSTNRQRQAFSLLKRSMSEARLLISEKLNPLQIELKNMVYNGTKFYGRKKDRSGDAKISDDRVYALLWALHLASQTEVTGNISESVDSFMGQNNKLKNGSRWRSPTSFTPGPSSIHRNRRDKIGFGN